MKTLKYTILVDAIDSYIYCDHLFLVLANGQLRFIPLFKISSELIKKYPEYETIFTLAFFRNDYFNNKQGLLIFGDKDFKELLTKLWLKAIDQQEFIIDIED